MADAEAMAELTLHPANCRYPGIWKRQGTKRKVSKGWKSRSSSFCIPENQCCKAEEEIATALKCLIWGKKSWGRKMRAGWPWSHRMEELCAPTCVLTPGHKQVGLCSIFLFFSLKQWQLEESKYQHVWVWASYRISTLLHTFLQMLYTVS